MTALSCRYWSPLARGAVRDPQPGAPWQHWTHGHKQQQVVLQGSQRHVLVHQQPLLALGAVAHQAHQVGVA